MDKRKVAVNAFFGGELRFRRLKDRVRELNGFQPASGSMTYQNYIDTLAGMPEEEIRQLVIGDPEHDQ